MTTAMQKRIRIYTPIKRTIDVLLSGIGILVLSPILLILCIAIKLDSPGPILFTQKRVGIHKSHFQIYKFRTMRTDTPKDMPTHMLNNPDLFITRVGRFLRKTWLDELPMLINWMKGDLKLVGVRPLSSHYFSLYSEELRALRIRTKPGLIPPFYADMPGTLDEIQESERRYLEQYLRSPFLTDWRYFWKAFRNIVFRGKRSR